MIVLNTGLPGNGKTLFTIADVKAWAEREQRPVFYNGIPELTLDWGHLEDPTKWMDVPPKSIVIIDEAQKIFRARTMTATPPKHVTDLETHRHLGIDLVFITQHPSLIDPAVRRLAGRHNHLVRIWGMEASTIHTWDSVKDNCDKPGGRKDSNSRKWGFDKTVYGLYKSAEVHTMKRSVPMRAKLLLAAPLVLLLLGYLVYRMMKGFFVEPPKPAEHKVEMAGGQLVPQNTNTNTNTNVPAGQARAVDPLEDAKQYMFNQTPRLVGLPQTAPKYDQLTVPTRVPVPAACVQVGTVADAKSIKCKCYTQQGTPMAVEFNMCIEFARNGFFQDFDPDKDRQASERSASSVQVLNNRADAALPVRDVQDGPRVGILPGLPMGPQRTDKSDPMDMTIQDGPPNNRATRAAAGQKLAGA